MSFVSSSIPKDEGGPVEDDFLIDEDLEVDEVLLWLTSGCDVSTSSPNSFARISRSRYLACSETLGLLMAALRPRSQFPGSAIDV